MTTPQLDFCILTAKEIKRDISALGARSGQLAELPSKCEEFIEHCRYIADNRKLDQVTIAFVGPRDAGKTTLLSSVIANKEVVDKLHRGYESENRTTKVTWIGPKEPSNFNADAEEWFFSENESAEDIGLPVAFVDVPGFDDFQTRFREIADFALASSLVKVLVIERDTIESAAIENYLLAGDGSMILPVLNKATTRPPQKDLDAFCHRLASVLPQATILAPIVVTDFRDKDAEDETKILPAAAEEIIATLTQNLRNSSDTADTIQELVQPQLSAALKKFQIDVATTIQSCLPATVDALVRFEDAENKLPSDVVASLFSDQESLTSLLRTRIRKNFLDATPVFLFPWRLMLSVAVLVWGVLDRLLLIFLGSIPSWVSAGHQAMRNIKDTWRLGKLEAEGLRKTIETKAAVNISPHHLELLAAIQADLDEEPSPQPSVESQQIKVEGIESAQETSSRIFLETLAEASPSRRFSLVSATLGTLLFWSIFVWPILAVYQRYADAVAVLLSGQTSNPIPAFPVGIGSMIATAAFLALIPTSFLLLGIVSWIARQSKILQSLESLKSRHISEIAEGKLLSIRLDEKRLSAVRNLHAARGK